MSDSKRVVSYFYDPNVGNYHYGPGHPMKPHRIRMTHSLVMGYGLYKYMSISRPRPATTDEMTQFHSDDYIDFLSKITPDNMDTLLRNQKFNVGEDCPVFDGMFDYSSMSAGASMEGAARLNRRKCDIAINWSGGLHHAKKTEASGFCYVNDIVLAILELLRYHQRVLYVDIDIHHGDGVEEAFYVTDRVMTVSFHKYGEYFPGTGDLRDVGVAKGRYYAVNVPLRNGMDDQTFKSIFRPIMDRVMLLYQPEAIVLQCGADSLSGDRLGCFNLSMSGHGDCLKYMRRFNIPMLVLGGGGYTIKNVSRTWAYETAVALDRQLPREIPPSDYYEYFGPEHILDVAANSMENMNTVEYIDKIRSRVLQNLQNLSPSPSAPMEYLPPDQPLGDMDVDDDENPDERLSQRQVDEAIARDDEFYDSDGETTGERYDRSYRHKLVEWTKARKTDDASVAWSQDGRNGSGSRNSLETGHATPDISPSEPPPIPTGQPPGDRHSASQPGCRLPEVSSPQGKSVWRARHTVAWRDQDNEHRLASPSPPPSAAVLKNSYMPSSLRKWPDILDTQAQSAWPPSPSRHMNSRKFELRKERRAIRRGTSQSSADPTGRVDDLYEETSGDEVSARSRADGNRRGRPRANPWTQYQYPRVSELRPHRRRRRALSSSSDSSLNQDTSSTTSVEELKSLHRSMRENIA